MIARVAGPGGAPGSLMPRGLSGASTRGRVVACCHAACLRHARERSRVRIGALVLWIANACIGLYLLSIWLLRGGIRRQATKVTRFPIGLIFMHPLFAAAGLGFWVAYVLSGRVRWAWIAFGILCVAALQGEAQQRRHTQDAERVFPATRSCCTLWSGSPHSFLCSSPRRS